MFVSCVLSGRRLCIGLIIRPEESYRVWSVWVSSRILHNEKTLAHWGLLRHDKKKYIYILRIYSNVLATQLFLNLWSWIHCTLHLFHLTLCSWCWKIVDFPENWSEFYTPPLFIRTGEHSERSSTFFLCHRPTKTFYIHWVTIGNYHDLQRGFTCHSRYVLSDRATWVLWIWGWQ